MSDRPKIIEVDVSQATSPEELHGHLMVALSFPSFYGKNWDAFWDAITGLIDMPERLILHGWSQLEQRLPREAKLLRQCLTEYNEYMPEALCQTQYA